MSGCWAVKNDGEGAVARMRERDFEQRYAEFWKAFESGLETAGKSGKTPEQGFPEAYRQLCNHLAMARQRDYSEALVVYLNRLVMAGHHLLYQPESRVGINRLAGALALFLTTLRRNRRFVICSASTSISRRIFRQNPRARTGSRTTG